MDSFIKKKTVCLNRIYDDIRDIVFNPIEGINISLYDNPLELNGNITLIDGIFKGIIIKLIIKFSFDYPHIPPKLLICPSQTIIYNHPGIFKSNEYQNYYEFYKEIKWNQNHTLRTLLFLSQKYLSDPKKNDFNQFLNSYKDILIKENININKKPKKEV